MTFFAPPWCAICGLPFPHPMGEEAVCADCARQKPSWDRARAVMRYDKHSRHLVLALKHSDRAHVARALGRWMGRAGVELLDGADIIVPVPLHWTRLLSRRYNQAGLLAHMVLAAGGPPVMPAGLVVSHESQILAISPCPVWGRSRSSSAAPGSARCMSF